MSTTKQLPSALERARTNIREQRFTTLSSKPKSGVYLFFSFDLVNSTQFKASHPEEWPVVVRRFYELIINELTTRLSSTIVWKFVGDEVLFFKQILKKQDLYAALPAAHDAQLATIELLHKNFSSSRELLDVKGTIWIAEAQPVQPSDIEKMTAESRNIIVEIGRSPTRDFLGPEIDVGFRISKFALRRRLVVSAELACILYRTRTQYTPIEEQLKIVSLQTLKGVWSGRHYPIVWFERDWATAAKTLLFDEHLVSDLAAIIKKGLGEDAALKTIEKVYADLGRNEEIDKLLASIEEACAQPQPEKIEIEIPTHRYAEIHCVAVCISPTGQILVGRRPSTKRRYPSCLEFGCGQLRLGESFGDCLKRAYKDDFGIDLILSAPLVPIRTFEINDKEEHRIIPGIIFFAEIDDPESVKGNFSKEKHSEVLWINPAEVSSFQQKCVPDFEVTISEALAAWHKDKARALPSVS